MAEYTSYVESEGINELQVYEELNAALTHLTDRGLNHAVKWTAEIINSLYPIISSTEYERREYNKDERLINFEREELSQTTSPTFNLAKSLFNLKEYHRVAHLLQTSPLTNNANQSICSEISIKTTQTNTNNRKEAFLRRYSLYLAGEKRKEEEIIEFQNHCPVINGELQNLREELSSSLFPSSLSPPPSPPPPTSSFSQSFSQSFSPSSQLNHFINRSIDQSANRSADLFDDPSIDELSINQSSAVDPSFDSTVDPSLNQSNQSPNHSTNQFADQSINESTNQSTGEFFTPQVVGSLSSPSLSSPSPSSSFPSPSSSLPIGQSKITQRVGKSTNYISESEDNIDQSTLNETNQSNIDDEMISQNETNQSNIDDVITPRDPFSLYLYALVLKELEMVSEAKELLIDCCNNYPWNWAAWSLLISLCVEVDHFKQVNDLLQPHYMKDFFVASLFVELQLNDESFHLLSSLSDVFPHSNFVLLQHAIAHFNLRNLGESERLFEIIRERDPYAMEGMDVYSNILYVTGKSAKLSYLAHHSFTVDKYSPETCYIIGNFYSLKGQHGRSALYFQRALKLNSKYLSAWTLLGHEYVELQKSDAAVHAYRKAVDLNARDYRAWYGLGQIYEMLKMTQYAIYYYSKASSLRPYDARMWCALGACYESLERDDEAIRYYERAVGYQDREGIAIKKLSQLYLKKKEFAKEAYYNKMYLDHLDSVQGDDKDIMETLLRLGDYCNYNAKKVEEAVGYYERLLNYRGKTKDIAKQRLLEIHNNQKREGNW